VGDDLKGIDEAEGANEGREAHNQLAELSKRGYRAMRSDHLEEAEECFREVLSLEEDNTYALVGLGDVARKRGDHRTAIGYYKRCLQHHESNNYALFGLADSYKALKEYKQAIAIWEKYLQRDERNITVLTRIADAYKKVRNFEKSRELYLRALEMEPGNPYALIGLGYLHFDFKHFDEALQYWRQVLDQPENARNIKILTAIGNCHRKLKTFEQGLEYFRRALEIEPENFYANFGMADCYRGMQDQERSLEHWLAILRRDPGNKVILTRAGDSFRILERLDEAEDYYRKALNIGYDAYAVLGLAIIGKERGRYAEAVESLEKLTRNDPRNARLAHTLAECYIALNQKDKAREFLTAFMRTGGRNTFVSELLDKLER
jgi:tetratricopeptide (TPR) repeat protein